MASDQLTITPDAVPSRRLDARTRNTKSGMLIAGPDQAFELTDTAAHIWKLLDGARTAADVGRLLTEEYDIDAETAIADTIEVLEVLAASKVINIA